MPRRCRMVRDSMCSRTFSRGAINVVPESGGFDPAEVVELIDVFDRALFFAAPTMVKRLVDSTAIRAARLDHLKSIVFGGGPMYVADCKAAFAALGPAPRADLRTGRVADDDYRDEPCAARRCHRARRRCAARVGGDRANAASSVIVGGTDDMPLPRGNDRRSAGARSRR